MPRPTDIWVIKSFILKSDTDNPNRYVGSMH